MIPGNYPTSSDVRCYINGVLIDDSMRIAHNEENAKIPIYSYNDKHWAIVADSKVSITGNLIINSRFPGYLLRAIERLGPEANTKLGQATIANPIKDRRRVITLMETIRDATVEERARLLATSSPEKFTVMSELLNSAFEIPTKLESHSPVELGPTESWGGSNGINLTLTFGKPTPIYGYVLENVHFTSCNEIVNSATGAGDIGGSGQPLLEIYTFIARRIRKDARIPNLQQAVDAADNVLKVSDLFTDSLGV